MVISLLLLAIAVGVLFLIVLGVLPGIKLDKAVGNLSVTTVNCTDLVATHAITSNGNMQVLGGGITVNGDVNAASVTVSAANISSALNVGDAATTRTAYATIYNGNMGMSGNFQSLNYPLVPK